MITARTPARRLTWILLPAPGLDLQPQTQTAFYILARRVGFCKIFLLEGAAHVPVNGAKNCINARKVTGSGYYECLRGGFTAAGHCECLCVADIAEARGVRLRCMVCTTPSPALVRGGFTAAGHTPPHRCCFEQNLDIFHENRVYVLNFSSFCIFILFLE